jgi:micrococcal nuclease
VLVLGGLILAGRLPSVPAGGTNATSGLAGKPAAGPRFDICGTGRWTNCVIDGDTVVHGGVRIRLADIDAPETRSARCAHEAELGRRAAHRLRDLLNDGTFTLVPVAGRDEDVHGRKLRVIERSGRSIGEALVAEGLARRWDGARRPWC